MVAPRVYKRGMKTKLALVLAASMAAASPSPALAQVGKFTIVNKTNIPFSQVMVRRFGGQQWLPLTVTPVPVPSAGGRSAVDFSDQDCAFDLQATLPDGQVVVWPRVNLCDARVVSLNRSPNGALWVDYE